MELMITMVSSMRTTDPLPFRRLTRPYEIGGYLLPAGTLVSNAVRILHRRDDLYVNPGEFNPDRFLDRKIDPYQWAPFGGGPRRCLGTQFALWEMKVVLAMALHRFDLTLVEKPGRATRSGFFLVAKNGVRVRARRRL